jgi:O-antigen ligase
MEQGLKRNNPLSLLSHFLYILFFFSLIFSFRAVTSISLGLILLTGLITNKSLLSSLFQKKPVNYFIAGCILLFLLQFFSLLYTKNQQEAWNHIRLKSGIAITPLAIYCSGYLNRETVKRLLFDFCVILAIASLYCLVVIFSRFLRSGDTLVFFYHQLVSPLKQHAVYFSLFVFTALVLLMESIRKKNFLVRRSFYIVLTIFFSIFLFLLSSKLVIAFFILYLLYYFIWSFTTGGMQKTVSRSLLLLLILSTGLLLATHNPVSQRFSEIVKGDIGVVKKQQYTPADYFNGLQFRVLQWKLVPEILNENRAWLAGLGAGDAQYYLDGKYISRNMYIGDPQKKDTGFLGYNTHNQFLQILLQNGIIGLLIFLFICFSLWQMAWEKRGGGTIFILLLLLTYALTESVFETQYGIIIFTFFPVLVYLSESGQNRNKQLFDEN